MGHESSSEQKAGKGKNEGGNLYSVSTAKQVEQGLSLQAQKRRCNAAEGLGYEIVACVRDAGISEKDEQPSRDKAHLGNGRKRQSGCSAGLLVIEICQEHD